MSVGWIRLVDHQFVTPWCTGCVAFVPNSFFPSLQDLGAAAGSKRPTCVIMVKPHEEYQEAYDECLEEVQALPPPM